MGRSRLFPGNPVEEGVGGVGGEGQRVAAGREAEREDVVLEAPLARLEGLDLEPLACGAVDRDAKRAPARGAHDERPVAAGRGDVDLQREGAGAAGVGLADLHDDLRLGVVADAHAVAGLDPGRAGGLDDARPRVPALRVRVRHRGVEAAELRESAAGRDQAVVAAAEVGLEPRVALDVRCALERVDRLHQVVQRGGFVRHVEPVELRDPDRRGGVALRELADDPAQLPDVAVDVEAHRGGLLGARLLEVPLERVEIRKEEGVDDLLALHGVEAAPAGRLGRAHRPVRGDEPDAVALAQGVELAPRLRRLLRRLERLLAEVRLVEAEHGGGLRAGREQRLQLVAEALLRAPGHREELDALRPGIVERPGLFDAPVVGPRDARRERGEVRRPDLVETDAALRARSGVRARDERER